MEASKKLQPSTTMPAPSVSAVLRNGDLLRCILVRLDVPNHLVHAALISKRWLATAADPAFLRDFRARCPPRLVGFLAVFGREPRADEDVLLRPSSTSSDDVDDAAAAIADASDDEEDDSMLLGDEDDDSDDEVVSDADDISRFVPLPNLPSFAGGAASLVTAAFNFTDDDGGPLPDLVRDCRNGRVLVIPSESKDTYAVHRPLRLTETGAADITQLPAPPRPVEHVEEPDRYVAQVVLVEPGTDDDALTCFNSYELTYPPQPNPFLGVIDVELRVNVLLQDDGVWVKHASSGLKVDKPLEPYEFPYNLLVGNTLYMLTIVGYIGVFRLAAGNFSLVKLPDGVSCGEGGVFDHRFARAGDTGLFLVYVKGPELHILHHLQATMEDAEGDWEWEHMDTIFLPTVFADLLGGVPLDDSMSAEIFAMGDIAEYIFLTVQGSTKLFLLHVKSREVENVLQTTPKEDGHLYRVFPFVMPWPPVFPALEEAQDD
ncbi:hypothetical protein PR202_ga07212 [Eleusine coracana subsp. coracana]|uniref:F-box protein AT5G49610-like beta-propeller domain-containing protein n=1 Tax=Eleusine coracana subsp. coracana TaxID=191504 RepID=A0AAV5BYP8_ELECO|nr:hypothetical protein QOZ80_2AG0109650 [Eleusine coracana subsp. coracana]GJM90889.1 hypothetical protein PR202_ga07212 [Eleusine coracana subsp. coracana]